jgi:tetratricopeptide (TPR) repeat protein/predicted Ser/Thr protein kinase
MPDDPEVFDLLQEMVESGKTPEDVCRDRPQLLAEVRRRWKQFRLVDDQIGAFLPDSPPSPNGDEVAPEPRVPGMPLIPGYDVEAELGSGGMGVVYKARHRALGRTVAIKMLLAGAFAGPKELARFRREAEALAGLRHANIVQVYDAGQVDGRPYFTMELVEGGSLAHQISACPQSPKRAAELIAILARAVAFAHSAGIVHRDLKPANVLVAADESPKITDFGLALPVSDGTRFTISGTRVGTPSYMAPEQALGKTNALGPAVDIYALGAVLYELLTGRPPFVGESAPETERRVIAEEPIPPSRLIRTIPRDLETICLKCLQKLPQHRYATALELAEDLRRFQRGEPITARPVSRAERIVRWARRKPTAAALIVTALTSSGAGVAYGVNEWRLAAVRRAEIAQWGPRLELVGQLEAEGKFQEAGSLLQRLPDADVGALKNQIRAALADLELVQTLDRIRLNRVAVVDGRFDLAANRALSDREYEAAFAAAGIGTFQDAPSRAAAAVATSPIRAPLIAALDDWSVCTSDESRRHWIFEVARIADPDPSGWRDRARVPGLSKQMLTHLAETAVVRDQSVQLLVALAQRMQVVGVDPTEFLRRVQQQYPGDFWACFTLAEALNVVNYQEYIRFCQAALALRPETAVAHDNVAHALGSARRLTESIAHSREAIRLEPKFSDAMGYLAKSLSLVGQGAEALELAKQAVSLAPRSANAHYSLAYVFVDTGQAEQAIDEFRRAISCDPTDAKAREHLAKTLINAGRYDEARTQLDEFRRVLPNSDGMHLELGRLLARQGHIDEAIAEYQVAVRLSPQRADAHFMLGDCWMRQESPQRALWEYTKAIEVQPTSVQAVQARRRAIMQLGLGEQARVEWANMLAATPADHDQWYGYAELCLYLGNQAEYERACRELLGRFESGAGPRVCEKVGRACLIGIVAPEDQKRAAALIERAVAAQLPPWETWLRPYFQQAQGLARYRAGDFAGAIGAIQGDALRVNGPVPHLVVSMAQARSGRRNLALGSLATAIRTHDWSVSRIRDQDGCISHSLRRETERVVMPNLTQLLAGHEKPRDHDERMALIAVCESMQRTAQAATLYADAFKETPALTQDWRYAAAGCAARAGCGDGEDVAELSDAERAVLREEARLWLRHDLIANKALLAGAPTSERAALRGKLDTWFKDPALACVRDVGKLRKLPSAEREAWVQLWHNAESLRAEARSVLSKARGEPSAAK